MNKKCKIILTILIITLILGMGTYLYAVKKSKEKLDKELEEAYNNWLEKVEERKQIENLDIQENNEI